MTGDHNVLLLLRGIDVKSQLIHLADLFEVKLERLWDDDNDIMSPSNDPACDVNTMTSFFGKVLHYFFRLFQNYKLSTAFCSL